MSWVAKHLTVHDFLSLKKGGFYHIQTRGGRIFITIHKPCEEVPRPSSAPRSRRC
jgi:hypothetical protein